MRGAERPKFLVVYESNKKFQIGYNSNYLDYLDSLYG